MLNFQNHQTAQTEQEAQRWRPNHARQCIKLIGPEDGPFESFVFTVNENIHSWYERKLSDPNNASRFVQKYGLSVCDDGDPNNLFEAASRIDSKNIKRRSLKMALPIFSLRQQIKVRRQGDDNKDYETLNVFRQGKDGNYLELSKINGDMVWQKTPKQPGDLVYGEALDDKLSYEGPSILAGSTATMASQLSNFVDLANELQGQCACCNKVGDEFNARPATLMSKGHFCGGCSGQVHVNHHAQGNAILCPHCKAETVPKEQYSCTAKCGDARPLKATEVYFRCTRLDGKNKLSFAVVLGKDGTPMKVNPDHILKDSDLPNWAEVFASPPPEAMQRLIGNASQRAAAGIFGGGQSIHGNGQGNGQGNAQGNAPQGNGGFGFASAGSNAPSGGSTGLKLSGNDQFNTQASSPQVSAPVAAGSPISNDGAPVSLDGSVESAAAVAPTDPMGGPVSLTVE